ncbi:DUF6653 family protein [Micromonospora sp. NPDC003197]
MNPVQLIARAFRMDDEGWRRHANPWSVWTRFAAIPPLLLGIWSRTWIGWWCLVPIAMVVVWLWINPHVFPPVDEPRTWTAKGIYGERLWAERGGRLPEGHQSVLRLLVLTGLAGFGLLAWGLVQLEVWPTVFGGTLVVVVQLWRIDRFTWLYERSTASDR